MYVDARSLSDGERLEADLCIVGAGAAGITLAREFIGSGLRVCLMESGTFEMEDEVQALCQGAVLGAEFFPLDQCRLRFFGGSTNHWTGFCRTLEPLDFAERSYIPHSGWPFGAEHMRPFYERAHKVCELGPPTYAVEDWVDGMPVPFALESGRLNNAIYQYSPPTRFGQAYRDELEKAANVTVLLHANAVDIETPAEPDRVTGIAAATLEGKRLRIVARDYVLATGGIENARILLNANRVQAAGLGNAHGLVGRYFGDHPIVWRSGLAVFGEGYPNLEYYCRDTRVRGHLVRGVFLPSEETLNRECMPNWAMTLMEARLTDASEGARSLKTLVAQAEAGELPDGFGTHVLNIVRDLDQLAESAWHRAFDTQIRIYTTRYWCETPPDPESRVLLVEERDRFGLQRAGVDWRLPGDFYANIVKSNRILAEEFGRLGIARLQVFPDRTPENKDDWPHIQFESSYHHMGTTRMHADPRRGVVDADARVHGISNLHVAGSSVFPTYGHANPTLTITALAIRLADHLKTKQRDL